MIDELSQYTDKIAIVVVKASKEIIRSRLAKKDVKKWEKEAYGYWEKALEVGSASFPIESENIKVFEVVNE